MRLLIWLVIGFAVVTWIMRTKSAFLKSQRGSGSSHNNVDGKAAEQAASFLLGASWDSDDEQG